MKDLENLRSSLESWGCVAWGRGGSGGPHCSLQLPERRMKWCGVQLFCHVLSEKMRENGLKLHHGCFTLDIKEKKLTGRVIRHWNKLLRAVVGSPALEVFKRYVDVALGDVG